MSSKTSIDELAKLTAKNKLIPFLGAGSSYGHLQLNWDEISNEMRNELDIEAGSNLEVAEKYVQECGVNGLCKFLESKLIVPEYDESLDIVPLIVLSLGIGLVYTTNQDNVFEKCIESYGRRFRSVTTLEDLSSYLPGENLLFKYHGAIHEPESIVFTESSYRERIKDKNHFLNIRMRSDLLTKSFLFVGYSFRDPNIVLIFEELYKVFSEKLPKSYLIAFDYTPELEIINEKYGVKIINPIDEISGAKNNVEAFEKYMTSLCEETYINKTTAEIDSLFKSDVPHATKVVSKYEIQSLRASLECHNFEDNIKFFRATFDACLIPETYHDDVKELYLQLCKGCSSRKQSDSLSAAAFNLHVNMKSSLEILAGVLATSIHRGHDGGVDIFRPIIKSLNSAIYPVAAARAVELISTWEQTMNDGFRRHATNWIEGYHELPSTVQTYIRLQMNGAWSGRTTYENPISYWERLGHRSLFSNKMSFESIRDNLIDLWPKEFAKPYEE